VTGALTTFTATVLPAYWRREFDMTAVVRRDGAPVKRYRLHDHETDVIQLFLVFAEPFVDMCWGCTTNNMTRHLARQMVRDGILKE
jgi:hypothetical protein